MTTILMTFTNVSWNKGSAAQVCTFVTEVRQLTTDVEFVLLSHCPELDELPAAALGIRLVGIDGRGNDSVRRRSFRLLKCQMQLILWGMMRRFGVNVRALADNAVAAAYTEAHVIADFSGDSYRDWPGGVSFAHNVHLIAACMVGTPVMLVSQSFGPFRWYGRWLSRVALNTAAFIYIRERRTAAILRDLKVSTTIALAPDIAFALPRCSPRQLLDIYDEEGLSTPAAGSTLIGVSTSHLMCRLHEQGLGFDYMLVMVHVIQYLRDRYAATILLIPHELKVGRDDRSVSRALAGQLGSPGWLKVIAGDYGPSEVKTLISTVDLLLAARLHAGIAGLSSNVPTILLSWSHKYAGVLEDIGLSQYVWDGNHHDRSALETLCDEAMARRQSIVRTLIDYNAVAPDRIAAQLRAALNAVNHVSSSASRRSRHAEAHRAQRAASLDTGRRQ